jgi:hypothetical protein
MAKPILKTVTVGLTDDEYAALLRLAADNKLRPTETARLILCNAFVALGCGTMRHLLLGLDDGGDSR